MKDLSNQVESITVSVSRKVNLGNYETTDAFASITVKKNDDPNVSVEEMYEYGWKVARHEIKNQLKLIREM